MNLAQEIRYEELRRAAQYGFPLNEEQKQFVQEFAMLKLNAILESDPNLMDALKRLKDR
jgi:hypothetical protein